MCFSIRTVVYYFVFGGPFMKKGFKKFFGVMAVSSVLCGGAGVGVGAVGVSAVSSVLGLKDEEVKLMDFVANYTLLEWDLRNASPSKWDSICGKRAKDLSKTDWEKLFADNKDFTSGKWEKFSGCTSLWRQANEAEKKMYFSGSSYDRKKIDDWFCSKGLPGKI